MGAKTKYIPGAQTKAAFRDLDSIVSLRQFSKLRHARSPRTRRLPGRRELEVQALIEAWIFDREAMVYAARDVLFDVVREAMRDATPVSILAMLRVSLALDIDTGLALELCEAAE